MKHCLWTFLLAFTCIVSAAGQKMYYDAEEDEGIYSFLKQVEPDVKSTRFLAVEMFDSDAGLDSPWGIYRISVLEPQSCVHYMLVKDGERSYIDGHQDTSFVLQTIVKFLDDSSCSEEDKFQCLLGIIRLRNNEYKAKGVKNRVPNYMDRPKWTH